MNDRKHIHCIGIGGIGISALARYYLAKGYQVTGTNMGYSPLLNTLVSEGIKIVTDASVIGENTDKIIYTEAIIDDDTLGLAGVRENHIKEIEAGKKFHSEILSYPEALAQVFHAFPMKIAVAGAHGKSTTSAMIGTILHDIYQGKMNNDPFSVVTINENELLRRMKKGIMEEFSGKESGLTINDKLSTINNFGSTTITGTLVKAFGGKNICIEGDDIMVIEACEYRNAFLNYKPDIAVITNIDPDHLDFFKTEENYQDAFRKFIAHTRCVIILDSEIQKTPRLNDTVAQEYTPPEGHSRAGVQNNRTLVIVSENSFEVTGASFNDIQPGVYSFTLPPLIVPGEHIRLDAKLAYVTSQLLKIDKHIALNSLAQYAGSWRRMEILGVTLHNNLFMSDYGHHPTEIIVTLKALKEAYSDRKLIVFFQPHQYSRTHELQHEFSTSFRDADVTYISDIYAARDIDERRDLIDSQRLSVLVSDFSLCEYVGTLGETRKKLQQLDTETTNALFLLLGAGDIDDLRDVFESKKSTPL